MINSKKGVVESTKVLMDIIIVAVILLVSLAAFITFSNLFSAGDHSLANFDTLTAKIQAMATDPDQLVYETLPYYISKDYILVGFNSEWTAEKNVNVDNADSPTIPKPDSCIGYSCLCIYESHNGDDFDDENEKPIRCVNYDSNIFFTGADGYEQYGGENYEEIPEGDKELVKKRWLFSFYVLLNQPEVSKSTVNFLNVMSLIFETLPKTPHLSTDNIEDKITNLNKIIEEYGLEFSEEIEYSPEIHEEWLLDFCNFFDEEILTKYNDNYPYVFTQDGAIDGYRQTSINSLFNFYNLYPLTYEYLILYGEGYHAGCRKKSKELGEEYYCRNLCRNEEEYQKEFGTRIIYLEKYEEGGNINILIAPYEGMVQIREQTSQDIELSQIRQAAMIGDCEIPYGYSQWATLQDVKEEHQEMVESIISRGDGTNPYDINPGIIYSIIYSQKNHPLLIKDGKYGLMELNLQNVKEYCFDLVTIDVSSTTSPTYSISPLNKPFLLDPQRNIQCGIKILTAYKDLILTNPDLDFSEENLIAAYYGGEEVLSMTPLIIPLGTGGIITSAVPSWVNNIDIFPKVEEVKGYYSCYYPFRSNKIEQIIDYAKWTATTSDGLAEFDEYNKDAYSCSETGPDADPEHTPEFCRTACNFFVNFILFKTDYLKHGENSGASKYNTFLEERGWTKISFEIAQVKKGDILVRTTVSSGGHGHVVIAITDGNIISPQIAQASLGGSEPHITNMGTNFQFIMRPPSE